MIKRFHEAPKVIFEDVQRVTSGDYALVNLFDEDPEYYELFDPSLREVILDNGVFELGSAWDADAFAGWVEKLRPTYYIVPDVLEDADATIESFYKFVEEHKGLPGKIIGVAQGSSFEELCKCYRAIEPLCAKVAIGFDFKWYQDFVTCAGSFYQKASRGRIKTLMMMEDMGVINTNKPHHMLGVMLPQEVRTYGALQALGGMRWIDSVDTSNPVVHGLKGIRYDQDGLWTKESQKLYTMIDADVSRKQRRDIMYNIAMFERYCNGY